MTVLTLFDLDSPRPAESYVYVIGTPGSSVAKIGVARDVGKRLGGIQNGNPYKLEVLWRTPGSYDLEGDLHRIFKPLRTYGEWFDFKDLDPVASVAVAVARLTNARKPDPAAVDPDVENPLYQANERGCRRYTPLERLITGFAYFCRCHGAYCPADWTW